MTPAGVSASTQGVVAWGAYLALYAEHSGALASLDVNGALALAKAHNEGDAAVAAVEVACGTVAHEGPRARSVFQIVPAHKYVASDRVVCYGDKIRLVSHEAYAPQPVALASRLKNPTTFSLPSHLQEVYATAAQPFPHASVWTIEHFDPLLRDEAEGHPVPANGRVIIRHCATNACLASTGKSTAPGAPTEVCVHTFFNTHKAEEPQNHWALVMDDEPPQPNP